MRVHILADKSQIQDYFLAPVRKNRKDLRKSGCEVNIYYGVNGSVFKCDILCLISKTVFRILKEKSAVCKKDGETVSFLKLARKKVKKIVWMDDSDSTTVTHFELMKYIDVYLKKQTLKDRTLYQKNFYGGRIFSDFYAAKYDIRDKHEFDQYSPLHEEDSSKLKLSWNIIFGDMYNAFSWKNRIRRRIPDLIKSKYNYPFEHEQQSRNIDLFIRTSADLGRESLSFHRRMLLEKLDLYLLSNPDRKGIVGNNSYSNKSVDMFDKKLPFVDYQNMMRKTKICPSPFGWGELGVRDYEAIIFGSLVLKPNMDHMETWPTLFDKGVTYADFSWDFSNLYEVIEYYLVNDNLRYGIVTNARKRYENIISECGMNEFRDHFIKQIVNDYD